MATGVGVGIDVSKDKVDIATSDGAMAKTVVQQRDTLLDHRRRQLVEHLDAEAKRRRGATPESLASIVGVAPMNRDSGTSSGHRFIQGGRAAARKALYMAALAAIRHGSEPIRQLYARLEARGKPGKVALVACMRKLLIDLNSRMRRLRQEPARKAA